jgi:hypothetical protein
MKLGNWFAALGCLGLGVGAVFAGQGCTATASLCTGATCPQFDAGYFPPFEDSGSQGVDSSTPTPDAGQADTGSTPIDPCNACLYGQCIGAYSNCTSNPNCLAIYQCATSPACAADGGNCVQDCFDSDAGSPLGQKLYLALGDCDQSAECSNITPVAACASTCNPPAATCAVEDAGAPQDSSTPEDAGVDAAPAADSGPPSCEACQASSCSAQETACASGTACAAYQQCLLGCASQACDTACATSNPAGESAAAALGTCTTMNCPQCNM